MSATRLLTTVALLAAATLGLTACDDNSTGSSAPTTAATAPSTLASVSAASAPASPTGHPSTAPKPSGSGRTATSQPPAPKTPSADCTTRAQHPGHKVIDVVGVTPGSLQLKATATRFVCGPDVPDDGYYESAGAPASYQLAPGATADLMVLDAQSGPRPASVADLIKHASECIQGHDVARPYGCYGNMYDITVDSAGHITDISELYHP